MRAWVETLARFNPYPMKTYAIYLVVYKDKYINFMYLFFLFDVK